MLNRRTLMKLHKLLRLNSHSVLQSGTETSGRRGNGGREEDPPSPLISCVGRDPRVTPGLPCTVPQGYCRAFTILLPIFTSSVLPTTAKGR